MVVFLSISLGVYQNGLSVIYSHVKHLFLYLANCAATSLLGLVRLNVEGFQPRIALQQRFFRAKEGSRWFRFRVWQITRQLRHHLQPKQDFHSTEPKNQSAMSNSQTHSSKQQSISTLPISIWEFSAPVTRQAESPAG